MAKKQMILYGVATLFGVSGIVALPSGNITGGVGCLVIAAACVFFTKKKGNAEIINRANNIEEQNTRVPAAHETAIEHKPPETEEKANAKSEYEFFKFKVAGVTFKNEDNTDRQKILRAIRFKDKPYDKELELEIKEYEFNGELAYGVYVNDKQIGNIPKKDIAYIKEKFNNIEAISNISVYGGGRAKESLEVISYGAEITVRIKK